jgi:hypothetical protein
VLAIRAVVRAAAGHCDAPDGGAALAAGLAGALVDAVLKLEKAADAIGINVVGDRGPAKLNGVTQDLLESGAKAFQLSAGKPACLAARTDARAEEAFIGIDIAHAGEQCLIQERGLDGELAPTEEDGKILRTDSERLGTGGGKPFAACEIAELEAAEAAWIDKADFLTAFQKQAGVSVRLDGRVGSGDEQTAGHAEVHDPLTCRLRPELRAFLLRLLLHLGRIPVCQFANNVLTGAVDGVQDAAFEAARLTCGGCFERFPVRAEPDLYDAVAVHAGVHTVGDGFNFREFGHEEIVKARWREAVPVTNAI